MHVTEPSDIFYHAQNCAGWTVVAINYDSVTPGGAGGVTWITLASDGREMHLMLSAAIEHTKLPGELCRQN